MPLKTLDTDDPPLGLREEIAFSCLRCETHALATKHVPVFVTLLEDWQITFAKYLALLDAIARAEAQRDAVDTEIDRLVDEVASSILAANNNDRKSDEFRAFFGSKQPHEVKQPILGDELEMVRGWIKPLKSNPARAELGSRAEALCAKADAAVAAVAAAKQNYRMFRLTGDYRQLVDKLNATRKDVYAALGKLPHSEEGKNLPADFADGFFKHETRRNKKITLDSVTARITALRAELGEQEQTLATLLEKAKAEAAADAEQKTIEEELAQAESAQADLAKKTAALRAKLKK